jgi:hypothetical protein
MISSLLMISPIDIGSSFWYGRTRITLICRTLLIECFGINFILLIPWRAPHLRATLHHNSGSAASRCQNWVRKLTTASPTQDRHAVSLSLVLRRQPNADCSIGVPRVLAHRDHAPENFSATTRSN